MPRYRFLSSRDLADREPSTRTFPNLNAARAHAVVYLGEHLKDEERSFWEDPALSITVQDARGLTLYRLDVVGTSAPAVTPARCASSN